MENQNQPESPWDYPRIYSKLPEYYEDVLKRISHPDVRKCWRDSLKESLGGIDYYQRYENYLNYDLCEREESLRKETNPVDKEEIEKNIANLRRRMKDGKEELSMIQTKLEKTHSWIFDLLRKQVNDMELNFYKKLENTKKEEN